MFVLLSYFIVSLRKLIAICQLHIINFKILNNAIFISLTKSAHYAITNALNVQNDTVYRKAATKPPVEDLANPIISNPIQLTDNGAQNLELEKGTSGTPGGTTASLPVDQGLVSQSNFVPVPVSDDEMRRQHQSATKVQAVFRGYLVILSLYIILFFVDHEGDF